MDPCVIILKRLRNSNNYSKLGAIYVPAWDTSLRGVRGSIIIKALTSERICLYRDESIDIKLSNLHDDQFCHHPLSLVLRAPASTASVANCGRLCPDVSWAPLSLLTWPDSNRHLPIPMYRVSFHLAYTSTRRSYLLA